MITRVFHFFTISSKSLVRVFFWTDFWRWIQIWPYFFDMTSSCLGTKCFHFFYQNFVILFVTSQPLVLESCKRYQTMRKSWFSIYVLKDIFRLSAQEKKFFKKRILQVFSIKSIITPTKSFYSALWHNAKLWNTLTIHQWTFESRESHCSEILSPQNFSNKRGFVWSNSSSLRESITELVFIMADTTVINTGRKSGVNKQLEQFFGLYMWRVIHVLQRLIHVNEIYFNHMIQDIEGKTKGPSAMKEESLRNRNVGLDTPDSTQLPLRNELPVVPITSMARTHLKANLDWFLEQKQHHKDDLRNDQMCLLVLSCFSLWMSLKNYKYLLFYKQETTSHSSWITASGYIQLFIFQSSTLSVVYLEKLTRIFSHTASVHVPSFIMHLRRAAEMIHTICGFPTWSTPVFWRVW